MAKKGSTTQALAQLALKPWLLFPALHLLTTFVTAWQSKHCARIVITRGASMTEEFVRTYLQSLDVVATSGVEPAPGVSVTLIRTRKQIRWPQFNSAMALALQVYNARNERKMVHDRSCLCVIPYNDTLVGLYWIDKGSV